METQTNKEVGKLNLPAGRQGTSAGFFFLSLGLLITLITSVVSFLNLIFSTLDKRFPDVLNATYQYGYFTHDYESIRMALATLIIFFPIFIIISYFWQKYKKTGLKHGDEVIRKWLVYIILFLSALVLAIDLVTLVRYFVSGEITTRFILKVLSVLLVASLSGAYYIFEIREKERVFGLRIGLWTVVKSSVLVLALIIWSFTVIGTPGQQRVWRLDDRRVQDLQNIQWQVINYWQQKKKLPTKLSDLANPLSGYSLPIDPEFEKGNVYEYSVKGDLEFELCATFSKPMPKGWKEYGRGGKLMRSALYYYGYEGMDAPAASYPFPGGGINESWDHDAGRTCFERTIDKDLYPPFK